MAGTTTGDTALNLMTTPVRSLIKRAPITLPPHTSIRAAAQLMSEQRVSSILIVEQGHLFGLITDRDLRNRVIAAGLDTAAPDHGHRHAGAVHQWTCTTRRSTRCC